MTHRPMYTPFFADIGKTLGAAKRRNTEADLAGSAYMGDQGAMEQLMRTNPQMGIQIQERKRKEQQDKLQVESGRAKSKQEEADRKRKIYAENRELLDGIFKNASKMEDYDEAKAYVQRAFEDNKEILGEETDPDGYTKEVYKQTQEIYGEEDNVQRSIDIPGEGTKQILETGEVVFKSASIEERQAFIKSKEAEIKQATSKAGKVEMAKLSAKAKQSLKDDVNKAAFSAQEQLPRIDNLENLAKLANTGTFGEIRTFFKKSFGIDVANEEEFMSESNRVILDAASALKGALSDRENAYLEAVAPDIGKSRDGNLRIIKNLKIIAQNSIERQDFLKKFKGDPVDFNYKGKSFSVKKEAKAATYKEGQVIINPKTGKKLTYKGGQWQ